MKRSISILLLVCLLAALLAGCASDLPSLPPLPGKEEASAPESTPLPEEEPEESEVAVVEEPSAPADFTDTLDLVFTLPSASYTADDPAWYFSPEDEFDCGFVYPAYCYLWVENGSVRLDPGWFFARMFFSTVRKDAEEAPDELLDLFEPGKWGTVPAEGTAGTGWPAMRALHLKYDTYRRWVAWETPERYYLLYGSCFDGREEVVGSIFSSIAASFRTSAELLSSAPERGTALCRSGGLELLFDGAELRGETPAFCCDLRLCVKNGSEKACELSAPSLTADGRELALGASCFVEAGEEAVWTISLPLSEEESEAFFSALSLSVFARSADAESLFEMPVRIELSE